MRLLAPLVAALALTAVPSISYAQNEGLADLDEAMVAKIDAQSIGDLEKVAALVESAIAKGLDEENKAFAQKMLGGISLQQGQAIVARMMRGRIDANQLDELRSEALQDLERAVENDPTLVDGHLLIARLNTLPGGDTERAIQAATAAIEKLGDDAEKQSEAYVLRAVLREDKEKQREDLDKALEVDPANTEAYQARALLRLQNDDPEGAVSDLKTLLEKDPTNTAAAVAASETLLQLDRTEDAEAVLEEAITAQPTAALYLLRAEMRRAADKHEQALSDLERALAIEPKNPIALLLRAEAKLREEDIAAAKADVDAALAVQPGNVRGIYLRSLIAAQEERYADAINDMQLLAQSQPENSIWSLQLGNFYQLDQRPRKAIDAATAILDRRPSHWQARRLRGDAYLSVNEHAKAIEDYEAALKTKATPDAEAALDPDAMSKTARSGLLNNLAWVLSTTPKDDLRNGKRALELATEAAELTEHQEPHILSTLAAAYAETGDFEKAIEWSSKAVELGKEQKHDQLEQLEKELESYRAGKPWREAQEIEENELPLLAPEDIIDT
ncbi:tetratricopeptide repeat protein [Candidatus Laterigemmans baculatus]|uniref:tetratricopeptide repeat protein n=1 Tax=Candidatus Laterigemmans baculatus TaxID=2770505 RepID=UPI001F4166F6|nr:tetratricopeptide repeat protein [Candidatus Laterigemmans baculatus]